MSSEAETATDKKQKQRVRKLISERVWESALQVGRGVGADAVLLYADALPDPGMLQAFPEQIELVLIVRNEEQDLEKLTAAADAVVRVPSLPLSRMDQIKIAVLLAVSRGSLVPDQRVVCLSGGMEPPTFDTIMVTEVGEEMEVFTRPETEIRPEDVHPEVFDRCLELATQLAYQGREGRPVGAIFVVGDTEAVQNYSKQLILNPFRGYSADQRNLLDPGLAETVKELATLDGAFIISGDGEVVSAGTYLRASTGDEELPAGLGARHAAAAGISASTNAIVLTVSESTGCVRVWKEGKILTELEKLP
ncbi:MAG: diadenylate cyclase [Planctomycetota bacterium]